GEKVVALLRIHLRTEQLLELVDQQQRAGSAAAQRRIKIPVESIEHVAGKPQRALGVEAIFRAYFPIESLPEHDLVGVAHRGPVPQTGAQFLRDAERGGKRRRAARTVQHYVGANLLPQGVANLVDRSGTRFAFGYVPSPEPALDLMGAGEGRNHAGADD